MPGPRVRSERVPFLPVPDQWAPTSAILHSSHPGDSLRYLEALGVRVGTGIGCVEATPAAKYPTRHGLAPTAPRSPDVGCAAAEKPSCHLKKQGSGWFASLLQAPDSTPLGLPTLKYGFSPTRRRTKSFTNTQAV